MTEEERINKAIEPLDNLIRRARKLLPEHEDHPDAIRLKEAYESMPVQINLNDPSLPVTSSPKFL